LGGPEFCTHDAGRSGTGGPRPGAARVVPLARAGNGHKAGDERSIGTRATSEAVETSPGSLREHSTMEKRSSCSGRRGTGQGTAAGRRRRHDASREERRKTRLTNVPRNSGDCLAGGARSEDDLHDPDALIDVDFLKELPPDQKTGLRGGRVTAAVRVD